MRDSWAFFDPSVLFSGVANNHSRENLGEAGANSAWNSPLFFRFRFLRVFAHGRKRTIWTLLRVKVSAQQKQVNTFFIITLPTKPIFLCCVCQEDFGAPSSR